jgi:hypothetical protein
MAADVSTLLKDIEFGPVDRKLEAIVKIRLLSGVDLSTVQPALEKVLAISADRTALKFYAACTLAALGDNRDVVLDALVPLMYGERLHGLKHDDDLIYFPWAQDEPPGFHAEASGIRYIRRFSPQVATIESCAYMRGSARAAQALIEFVQNLGGTDWRLFAIYAAGANGHPLLRQSLEYLRDREPSSVEAEAARIALDHFGTSGLFEIAQLHGSMRPAKKGTASGKSGCFIATAVYGRVEMPEVKILQRFRDQTLLPTRLGRGFVNAYYLLSPPMANLIRDSERGKAIVKKILLQPVIWWAKRTIGSDMHSRG